MTSRKVDALVTIKRSGALGLRYEFDERTWCSIGAHADCDIRIHAEKVAVLHGLVSILEDGPLIYGLDKDFPIEIPERQISLSDSRFAQLRHGDVFFVGERAFRFESANGPVLPTPAVSKSLSRTSGADIELQRSNENVPPVSIEAVSKRKKKSRKSLLITDTTEKVVEGPKRASIIHKSRLSLPASKIVQQLVLDNELNLPVKYSDVQPKSRKSMPVFQSAMGQINVKYGQTASATCAMNVLGEKRKKEAEVTSTPASKQPKDVASKTPEIKPISTLNFYSTPTKTMINLTSETPTIAAVGTPKINPAITPTKKPTTLLPKTPPTTPAPILLSEQKELTRTPAQGSALTSKSLACDASEIAPAQVNRLPSRPALTPMKAGTPIKSIAQRNRGGTLRNVSVITPRMPTGTTPRTIGEMTPRMTQKSSEGFSLSSSFPSPFAGPRNEGTPVDKASRSTPLQARMQIDKTLGIPEPRRLANFAGTPTRNLSAARRVPIFERVPTTPTRNTANLTPRRVPLSERPAMPSSKGITPRRVPFADRLRTPSGTATGGDQRRNMSALTPRRNISALTPRRLAKPGGAPPSTPTRKQVGTPRRVVADPTALRPSITKPNSGLSRLPPRTPKRMRVETLFTPSESDDTVPAAVVSKEPIEVNPVKLTPRIDSVALEKAQRESPARSEAVDKFGIPKKPDAAGMPDPAAVLYPVEEDSVLFDSAPLEKPASEKPVAGGALSPCDKLSLKPAFAASDSASDGQRAALTPKLVNVVKARGADGNSKSSPAEDPVFTPRRSPRMHSSTPPISTAPALQMSMVNTPKSTTSKAPVTKRQPKALRTPRPKTPVRKTPLVKRTAVVSVAPTASTAQAPGSKTPTAESAVRNAVSRTPKIAAANASVEIRAKALLPVSKTPSTRTPAAKSQSAEAPVVKLSKQTVSKASKIGAAKAFVKNRGEALTPVSKSPAANMQSVKARSGEAPVTNSLVVASTGVLESSATPLVLSDRPAKTPTSKTPSSASRPGKITIGKVSAPITAVEKSTDNETPTSKSSQASTDPTSSKAARATPASRSSLPKSLVAKTPTYESSGSGTIDERDPQTVDPNGPASKAQVMPNLSVPRTPQESGTMPKFSPPHLPALTPTMSSARKPPRGWSRGSPAQKDHMHSVVKTIAKSTRKRSKSIVFAPQIELEKGPHYSPRVSKHVPRTPEAFATPDKKEPEVSSTERKHVPRCSPGARQRDEPEQRTRVLGSPPTSRLAALGTFFFPVFPTAAASQKNEQSGDQNQSCDSLETSESPGSMQSGESDETTTSDDPVNLSQNLDRERQEPEDEFDIDSETDESTDDSGEATTSTVHTPARRRSFGQRLSGLFFGTPALDVESPREKESENSEKEEFSSPIAAGAGPVAKEESETPTEEPESEGGGSDSEASSSPSNASESEFLTVRDEPIPQEPTSRRKSLLGSAFSAVVAAVASPARGLFSRRASSIIANKTDEEENLSNSGMDDQTPRSDLATVNSDTCSEEVEQKSGEQLQDTTSNLLDRFNTEAEIAREAEIVPPKVKNIPKQSVEIHSNSRSENLAISDDKTAVDIEVVDKQKAVDVAKSRSTMEDNILSYTEVNQDSNSLDVEIATTPKSVTSEGSPAPVLVGDANISSTPTSSVEEDTEKPEAPVVNLVTPMKNQVPHTPTDYNTWKVKELHEYLTGINVVTSRTMRKAELVALAQNAEVMAVIHAAKATTDTEEDVDEHREDEIAQEKNFKVTADPATWKVKQLHDYLSGIDVPTSRTMRKAELVALVQNAQASAVDKEEEADQDEVGNMETDSVSATPGTVKSREELRELLTERKVPYLRDLLRQFGEDDKGRKAELIDTLLSEHFENVMRSMDAENEDETVAAETSIVQEETVHDAVESDIDALEAENAVPEKYEERKSELKAMTVKKLQVILGKLKLDKVGKKDVLVDRILSAEFAEPVVEEGEEKAKDDDTQAASMKSPFSKPSRHVSTSKKTGKVGSAKDEVVDLQRMTVAQLRKYLRENNSCSFGLKAALVARAEQIQSGTRPKRKAKDNTLCAQCLEGKLCAGPK